MQKNQIRWGLNTSSQKQFVIGNRIPKDFFITTWAWESDITVHAGSYHLALKAAGIEMGNIMTYSSILPKIANKVERPKNITHGEVIESIMAVAHWWSKEQISAWIIYWMLYDKKTKEKYWWLVCEHNGNYSDAEIEKLLRSSLNELYINWFDENYDLKDISIIKETFTPQKKYGTVIIALCFVSYVVPVL